MLLVELKALGLLSADAKVRDEGEAEQHNSSSAALAASKGDEVRSVSVQKAEQAKAKK